MTSNLEDHVGYWLRFVSNQVSHAFKLKVLAHDVTVAEWVVLRVLFETGPVNPSEVATKLSMTRGAISKLADRLAKKRLVICKAGKEDRRFQTLALSPAGKRLVPKLAACADQNDTEFFGNLTDDQRELLVTLLQKIVSEKGLKDVPIT